MERLTMRNDKGMAYWVDKRCSGGGYRMTEDVQDQKRIDRLAAYEDTGLTPDEIMAAANRRHDCKIDCLLAAHNKLLDEIEQLGGIVRFRKIVQAEKEGRLEIIPTNVPLTLQELQEKGYRDCVWIKSIDPCAEDIFDNYYFKMETSFPANLKGNLYFGVSGNITNIKTVWKYLLYEEYGKTWLAYRRKPEEEAE